MRPRRASPSSTTLPQACRSSPPLQSTEIHLRERRKLTTVVTLRTKKNQRANGRAEARNKRQRATSKP
eukprot:1232536-Prorocentrum_lima.AAC.1